MALHIKTLHSSDEFLWHIGQPMPDYQDIFELQADGDELECIIKLFTTVSGQVTIPSSIRYVNSWYGDIAKTIHQALR